MFNRLELSATASHRSTNGSALVLASTFNSSSLSRSSLELHTLYTYVYTTSFYYMGMFCLKKCILFVIQFLLLRFLFVGPPLAHALVLLLFTKWNRVLCCSSPSVCLARSTVLHSHAKKEDLSGPACCMLVFLKDLVYFSVWAVNSDKMLHRAYNFLSSSFLQTAEKRNIDE